MVGLVAGSGCDSDLEIAAARARELSEVFPAGDACRGHHTTRRRPRNGCRCRVIGSIKGNSGEISDLVWQYGDGAGRQLDAIYERRLVYLRRLARKDHDGRREREVKNPQG
jgi:hypothetical protein